MDPNLACINEATPYGENPRDTEDTHAHGTRSRSKPRTRSRSPTLVGPTARRGPDITQRYPVPLPDRRTVLITLVSVRMPAIIRDETAIALSY